MSRRHHGGNTGQNACATLLSRRENSPQPGRIPPVQGPSPGRPGPLYRAGNIGESRPLMRGSLRHAGSSVSRIPCSGKPQGAQDGKTGRGRFRLRRSEKAVPRKHTEPSRAEKRPLPEPAAFPARCCTAEAVSLPRRPCRRLRTQKTSGKAARSYREKPWGIARLAGKRRVFQGCALPCAPAGRCHTVPAVSYFCRRLRA